MPGDFFIWPRPDVGGVRASTRMTRCACAALRGQRGAGGRGDGRGGGNGSDDRDVEAEGEWDEYQVALLRLGRHGRGPQQRGGSRRPSSRRDGADSTWRRWRDQASSTVLPSLTAILRDRRQKMTSNCQRA